MRQRSKLIRGATLFALLSLVTTTTAACGGSAGKDTSVAAGADSCPTKETTGDIVLTASSNLAVFAPVLLAVQDGAFKNAGLNVTVQRLSAAESVPLVAQGKIDAQVTSYSSAQFNAVSGGVNLKWFMPLDTEPQYSADAVLPGFWSREDVVGNGAEPNLAALRGQTVGSPTAATGISGKILNDALTKAGLGLGDVKVTRLVGADALAALENKAVAATWIASPAEVEASKAPGLRRIATYAPGVTGSSIIAGPKLLDRPAVAVKFAQVVSETVKKYLSGDYRKNPDSVAALTKALGVDASIIQQTEPLVFDPALSMDGTDKFVADLQDFFLKAGGLDYKKALPADQLLDTSVVNSARTCARTWMTP
jgi:ABC-type nitrate/sulfonate/bicarbonate transport system substrate-binding protein